MLLIILRAVFALVCAGAIATYVSPGATDLGDGRATLVLDLIALSSLLYSSEGRAA